MDSTEIGEHTSSYPGHDGIRRMFRREQADNSPGGTRGPGKSEGSWRSCLGSDQGLVGQFNEVVADYAIKMLHAAWQTPDLGRRGASACLSNRCSCPQVGLFRHTS